MLGKLGLGLPAHPPHTCEEIPFKRLMTGPRITALAWFPWLLGLEVLHSG